MVNIRTEIQESVVEGQNYMVSWGSIQLDDFHIL